MLACTDEILSLIAETVSRVQTGRQAEPIQEIESSSIQTAQPLPQVPGLNLHTGLKGQHVSHGSLSAAQVVPA